jgi:hypothetical protein
MRTEAGWSDVTIRDISSRGLGLRSARAPRRGDYVEVCRHHHKLIGRVMWAEGESFGVMLSDAIVVDDLLSSRPAPRGKSRDDSRERRVQSRRGPALGAAGPQVTVVSMAENSRHAARLMNFVAVAAIACIGAAIAASLAGSVLSEATEAVSAALVMERAQLSAD